MISDIIKNAYILNHSQPEEDADIHREILFQNIRVASSLHFNTTTKIISKSELHQYLDFNAKLMKYYQDNIIWDAGSREYLDFKEEDKYRLLSVAKNMRKYHSAKRDKMDEIKLIYKINKGIINFIQHCPTKKIAKFRKLIQHPRKLKIKIADVNIASLKLNLPK